MPPKKLTLKDLLKMDNVTTRNDKIIIITDKKLARDYNKAVQKNIEKELKKSMPWLKSYY